MRVVLIIFLVAVKAIVYSQSTKVYETNAWGSVVWNHSFNNRWGTTIDVGHRTCDKFVLHRRQAFIRGLLFFKIGTNWRLGAGIAQFQHHNPIERTKINESRPFLQLNYGLKWSKWSFNFRLREELRRYTALNKQLFRTRLQGQIGWGSNKSWLNLRVDFEGFITPIAHPIIESRTSLSNTINYAKRGSITLFYILQTQSTLNGKQHIIGLQFTFNSGTNE